MSVRNLIAAGLIAGGFVALLIMRPIANTSGATSNQCSIAAMAQEYGVTLTSTSGAAPAAESAARTDLLAEFPGAIVAQEEVATLRSASAPVLDGHRGLLMQIEGVPGNVAGPAGAQPPVVTVTCAVSVYDADTGQFLTTMKDMVPVAPAN